MSPSSRQLKSRPKARIGSRLPSNHWIPCGSPTNVPRNVYVNDPLLMVTLSPIGYGSYCWLVHKLHLDRARRRVIAEQDRERSRLRTVAAQEAPTLGQSLRMLVEARKRHSGLEKILSDAICRRSRRARVHGLGIRLWDAVKSATTLGTFRDEVRNINAQIVIILHSGDGAIRFHPFPQSSSPGLAPHSQPLMAGARARIWLDMAGLAGDA
jgi:hypothetical protein